MFSMFSVPGNGAVRKGLAVQQTFIEDLSAPLIVRKGRPSIESVAWSEAWNLDATKTYEDVEREEDLDEAERSLEEQEISERSASEVDWPMWVKDAVREQDVSASKQTPISPLQEESAAQEEQTVERKEAIEEASTEEKHGTAPKQVGCRACLPKSLFASHIRHYAEMKNLLSKHFKVS